MSRTIYRQPYTVNTDVNIDTKYHSHSNWKGISDDKNYLNVDQETFEDCKNVYMSSDGLLKSRPSIKYKNGSDVLIKKWVFGNVSFAITENGNFIQLTPEKYLYRIKNPVIFQKEGIIFVFEEGKVWYYDDVTGKLEDGSDLLYIPETKIYTDGIANDVNPEDKNLLINLEKQTYNYTDFNNVNTYNLPTNVGELQIGSDTYDITLEPKVQYSFVSKRSSLSKLNYDTYGIPLISVSSKNTAVLCERVENDVLTYLIYYTSDFITWSLVDVVNNATSVPKISDDGSLVYYLSDAKVLVKSLVSLANNVEYPVWTELFSLPDFDDLGSLDDETRDVIYNRNLTCNVKIINPTYYAACYGVGLDTIVDYTDGLGTRIYPNAYIHLKIYAVMDGVVHTDYRLNGYYIAGEMVDFDFNFYYNANNSYIFHGGVLFKRYLENYNASPIEMVYRVLSNTGSNAGMSIPATDDLIYNIPTINSHLTLLASYDDHNSIRPTFIFTTKDLNYTYLNIVEAYALTRVTISDSQNFLQTIAASKSLKRFISFNSFYFSHLDLNDNVSLLHDKAIPIAFIDDKYYYIYDNEIYVNSLNRDEQATLKFSVGDATINSILFEHNCELNEEYVSEGNNLYISKNVYDDDGKFKLYFPKETNETFNKPITNLYPVSENQVAIFFDDEVWYVQKTELGHEYYKSKLQVGLKEGSDVITSQDGKNIIFSSTRGLVYMSYQELVQSTEQILTYLSDTIYDRYKEFNKKPVKLFLNDFWLYCYHTDENVFYVFDIRNNSWWIWEYYYPILDILIIDDEPELLLNMSTSSSLTPVSNSMVFDYSYNNYYDDVPLNDDVDEGVIETNEIDWFIVSQKLHLGTLNYYKNIASITINNVQEADVSDDQDVMYYLNIKNYRKNIAERYSEPQNLVYKVNTLRTFVKRCNSRKVNEFQYIIESDIDNAIRLPLSIHSIVVKYTISGQVR